ncbi:glycosyltransferase family 2 protein [Butyrivibrio sp. FC2001]|uniref:glycosyltransferase family 2 protein n=1 Tax=Butyrivibrio sp. FC2001 TaxID=1280671 RepID=UPI00040FA471|nr:glycosyltransferase family 2 protein [Butyrivibrio sp. FC2001]
MEKKVTVVVPSYNTEKQIEKCLDTICAQTLSGIEIIVVDDGSTDNTVSVAEEYAKKDSRISVIKNQHSNAGEARNTGLDRAEGEYIVFWDSDDFFALTALEKLYKKCKAENADICICDAFHVDDKSGKRVLGNKNNYQYLVKGNTYNRKINPDYILNITTNVPWNKMFRTGFIKDQGIRFQSIERANDAFFTMSAMTLAERITIIKDPLIYWRTNQKISTTSDKSRSPMCVFKAFEETERFLEERGVYDEVKKSFLNRAVDSYLYSLKCQKSLSTIDNFRESFDYIKNEAFGKLGWDKIEPTDIYKQNKYETLKHVTEGSYEEYMIFMEGELQEKYNKTINSKVYKLAKRIAWFPRMLRKRMGKKV